MVRVKRCMEVVPQHLFTSHLIHIYPFCQDIKAQGIHLVSDIVFFPEENEAVEIIMAFRFGHALVSHSTIFFETSHAVAFVNIKCVVPGHVLLASKRCVPRYADLNADEVSDLFLAAQRVSTVVQRHFNASSMTMAVQDGPEAGQTVQHVHVHILPRKAADFVNNDDIYSKLELHDRHLAEEMAVPGRLRPLEDMEAEARTLRSYFQ